ncbi:hypothetical protein ACWDUL_21110 [Nocardia niigatensis]
MTTTPADQPPRRLPTTDELAPPVTTIGARSTATLATDLAALIESGGPDGPHGWGLYHAIIDTLCTRHPAVQAAWEAWADTNEHLPARDRVLAGSAILPTVQRAASTRPLYTVTFDNGEVFETSYPTAIPELIDWWAAQQVKWLEIAGPDINGKHPTDWLNHICGPHNKQ